MQDRPPDAKNDPREIRDKATRELALLAKMIGETASNAGPDHSGFENWEVLTLSEMLEDLSDARARAGAIEIEAENAEKKLARALPVSHEVN
jgi:hypothetical protein